MFGFGQLTYVPDDNFENYLENAGMGNGVPNDDYVTTANINTVSQLLIQNENISDLTGIEDFIALEWLECFNNTLTNLPLSNPLLTRLHCGSNPSLSNLDVSQSPNLGFLDCEGTGLTNIDLSNNTALYELKCENNSLTSLDLSNNVNLVRLYCFGNNLTSLDLSCLPNLTNIHCYNNDFTSFNLKNGNNINIVQFIIYTTPNLNCIEVDDPMYSTANWTVGPNVTFSTNCNFTNPCNTSSSIQEHTTNKQLLRTIDILGRETKDKKNEHLFYIYDDGTVEKRIVIE